MPYADPQKRRAYLTKYARAWYSRNRERDLKRQKAWRESNKSKLSESRKAYRKKNRTRLAAEQQARRKANRAHVALIDRRSAYKVKYGITVEEFDAMLSAQDGKCLICDSSSPGGRWSRFAVDHCHVTGLVRGLLCMRCNSALGWYEKNVSKIGEYLSPRPLRLIRGER